MAIRIDLLPKYVRMRRWFKRILLGSLALVGATAGILFLLYYSGELRLKTAKENLEAADTRARLTEAAVSAAETAKSEAEPMKSTISFIVDAGRSGPERAALLDLIRRYIYSDAIVGSLDISDGQTVRFGATIKTPDDYARFLLNLRRASEDEGGILFKTKPVARGIPGFPPPLAVQVGQTGPNQGGPQQPLSLDDSRLIIYPLKITAEGPLRNPVTVPVEPGAPAGGAGGPGAPGSPGPMGSPSPMGSPGGGR